jgi:hypothetical protein
MTHPRYVPDERALRVYDFFVRHPENLPAERRVEILLKARYELARAAIGEPVLKDQVDEIPLWINVRELERSRGLGAHRSEVPIIFDHQELWGITDRTQLTAAMRSLLSGIQKDIDE